jgi:hypothetical protein
VWDRALRYDRQRRGFADPWQQAPHYSIPSLPEGDGRSKLNRALLEEDVRGSFSAICEMAGWWAELMPCDPDNRVLAQSAAVVAEELEDMARGLRRALRKQLDALEHDEGEGL